MSTNIDACYIHAHKISALGDSSITRYGVNNIFQRDVRPHVRTHVRTYVRTSSQSGVNGPLEQKGTSLPGTCLKTICSKMLKNLRFTMKSDASEKKIAKAERNCQEARSDTGLGWIRHGWR